jgi:hypothetical protein
MLDNMAKSAPALWDGKRQITAARLMKKPYEFHRHAVLGVANSSKAPRSKKILFEFQTDKPSTFFLEA